MKEQTPNDDKQPSIAAPVDEPAPPTEAALAAPTTDAEAAGDAEVPAKKGSFLAQLEAIIGLGLPIITLLMAWFLIPAARLGAVNPNEDLFKFFNAITFGLFAALPWLAGSLIFVLVVIAIIWVSCGVLVGGAVALFSLLGDTYGGRYRHLSRPLAALGFVISLLAAWLLLTRLWRLLF
jgi:hypothetical protein